MALSWLTRSLRPPDPVTPNDNPAGVPPASVGPPDASGGDPHGVMLVDSDPAPPSPPARILPSAWDGWPSDWWPPPWYGRLNELTDLAWGCIDTNTRALGSMPPYLVGSAPTLDSGWLVNPDPDLYYAWDEFARQLFWDWYAAGEVFVLATAFYSTGWPARFHVVPPWMVNVEMDGGTRSYSIGETPVPERELLHLRYQSTVDDSHGHGPLEAGRMRLLAAEVLGRYGTNLASQGGIPSSVLEHPEELTPEQAAALRDQWVIARQSALGAPAVLSGGVKWTPTQLNPQDMALLELSQYNEARICILLGVPPFLMGLPGGGDSMTYSNVTSVYDFHWRSGLRPTASAVMAGLSEWLLPRGTTVEVNKDAYVQPPPLERAQTYEILNRIVDADGTPVLSVEQIQQAERFRNALPSEGALR